jgi:hypothetical protein
MDFGVMGGKCDDELLWTCLAAGRGMVAAGFFGKMRVRTPPKANFGVLGRFSWGQHFSVSTFQRFSFFF